MKNATHTNTHKHTRFTQVRGPRVEVTPLLLPVSLLSGVSQVTMCSLSCFTHTEISLRKEVPSLWMSRVWWGRMEWFLASSLA